MRCLLFSATSLYADPSLENARLIIGLDGWMDGGEVSTATVETLAAQLGCEGLGEIPVAPFNLLSFPGDMETSALFRPGCRIENGLVQEVRLPSSLLFYQQEQNLLLLRGREPQIHWRRWAKEVFDVAEQFHVAEIYFVGSVAGMVPHTREARIHVSCSNEQTLERMLGLGFRAASYEGPASISTYLTSEARDHDISMTCLVAEIPAYIHGRNQPCIETMVRRLGGVLDLPVDTAELRQVSDRFEEQVNEAIADRAELQEGIGRLEEAYDREVFDTDLREMKSWLQQQGIRLD
jgi:predicted ATP-grasp superfamily ATP-dependent carboligase